MSRVITFSRTYPSYHPRAGQQTYFVEKFLNSILLCQPNTEVTDEQLAFYQNHFMRDTELTHEKHHTIRAGSRWKVGDKFSPRVWSGKPYNSKQITIAPDIEIMKLWEIRISIGFDDTLLLNIPNTQYQNGMSHVMKMAVAENDGLSYPDFYGWFNSKKAKPFEGQIICWNDKVEY